MRDNTNINKELISNYKEHLKENGLNDEIYKWQLVSGFKGRPNVDAQDFGAEISLIDYSNLIYPVALSVIKFIAKERPEEYRKLYVNLFDDIVDINIRIKNFISESKMIYDGLKSDERKNHNQDERTVATILTYYNPDKYTFFKDSFYQKYCKLLGVSAKVKGEKYKHYLGLIENLKLDILEDEELIHLFESRLPDGYFKDSNHNLLAQDILYQSLDVLPYDEMDKESDNELQLLKSNKKETTQNIMNPLNQILFGPPGTGKTYHTINKAIQIIDPDYDLNQNREEIKKRYNELVQSGQIVFTTFHQSMSYEDFIEGIKPNLETEEDGNVSYLIKPGIFKLLCDKAKDIVNVSVKVDWDSPKYYKMSLGGKHRPDIYNWSIENKKISIGYGGDNDLSPFLKFKKWDDYKLEYTKTFPNLVQDTRFNIQATYAFLNMKVNDIVVVSKGNHIIDAIGIVKSNYYWDDNSPIEHAHFRDVEWIANDLNISPERFINKKISQMSIYEFYKADIKYEAFKALTANTASEKKNYVIIIDEINRGNVSQIFGELITLIEEDKRRGKAEAIDIDLPYSKTKFSVPDNVYIIGTMNTADRSVEALDTALRRRFVFEEMSSNPDLLNPFFRLGRVCGKKDYWTPDNYNKNKVRYKIEEIAILQLAGLKADDTLLDDKFNNIIKDLSVWMEKSAIEYEKEFEGAISQVSADGIRLDKMLRAINERLEILLDKDHQIGHAFFMDVLSIDDLKIVFKNKIIPLLQEYFYGDIGKISLVLGDSFIKKSTKDRINLFPTKEYDSSLISELESKETYSFTNSKEWNFRNIYENVKENDKINPSI